MDKADDSHALRATLEAQGLRPVIPPQSNRLDLIGDAKERYQQRNHVERFFNTLKPFRRVAPRYETLTATFLAFVLLACIVIMLRE